MIFPYKIFAQSTTLIQAGPFSNCIDKSENSLSNYSVEVLNIFFYYYLLNYFYWRWTKRLNYNFEAYLCRVCKYFIEYNDIFRFVNVHASNNMSQSNVDVPILLYRPKTDSNFVRMNKVSTTLKFQTIIYCFL